MQVSDHYIKPLIKPNIYIKKKYSGFFSISLKVVFLETYPPDSDDMFICIAEPFTACVPFLNETFFHPPFPRLPSISRAESVWSSASLSVLWCSSREGSVLLDHSRSYRHTQHEPGSLSTTGTPFPQSKPQFVHMLQCRRGPTSPRPYTALRRPPRSRADAATAEPTL